MGAREWRRAYCLVEVGEEKGGGEIPALETGRAWPRPVSLSTVRVLPPAHLGECGSQGESFLLSSFPRGREGGKPFLSRPQWKNRERGIRVTP